VQAAGLVEVYTDDDGDEAMRLSPEGEKVARELAMTDDDGADAPIKGLLGVRGIAEGPPRCGTSLRAT